MDYKLTYRRYSERSILVEWPHEISDNILKDVLNFKHSLMNDSLKSIIQINNAYNSLLISYDITIDSINDEFLVLKSLYSRRENLIKSDFNLWKVPVCYDDEFGIDLDEISKEKNISKRDIIRWHSEAIYTVYFIGFLPGFLYLGGLDDKLFFPRKMSPRTHVKKGAVAIGGQQTGIYPNVSPGGWNIIGNSPLNFFDLKKEIPCFANAGDNIQFVPVNRSQYDIILSQVEQGTYQIESEVFDG